MSTNSSTTVLEWLKDSSLFLEASSETPRLDSLILLEDSLGIDRANLLAHPEKVIKTDQLQKLDEQLAQRAKYQPLAYIRKKASFYGRDFFVDNRVLVPRPESETIIDELIMLKLPPKTVIADIGTGSGILGITATLEITESSVDLYDISPEALAVAQQNAQSFSLKPQTVESTLLENLLRTPQVVLANLPYVPDDYLVSQATKHEPRLALYAGSDGMSIYREFWRQLGDLRIEYVITESLPIQHIEQLKLANNAGYKSIHTKDLVQVFRKS